VLQPLLDPFGPLSEIVACRRREPDDPDSGVDFAGIGDASLNVEFDIGQQIGLVDHHQIGGIKHIRVFERFVFAFGYGENDHLMGFAQIERGRTHGMAGIARVALFPKALEPAWRTEAAALVGEEVGEIADDLQQAAAGPARPVPDHTDRCRRCCRR